ncbi:uncharacterized protein AMSG_00064 [Thecamonas trahens ATCC 50062]|uniref:Uncharacterized protein n=1 Tax=Thecamonas trahens ATCC 50062 TaxID=461836 RepID=A0A0L0D1E2_THETB|nr:hypothetical protein AMSG_00064 [Thecamonas trahens ATCC 50062]KNC45950.1 hypothetical protein AMSG_00064 [Thecamonas trahens ATCC 50062]|eukprot:XP_013762931.1 hypothetical protein AMSG_00064 [Thecamonas trahens ATCC 50062]
MEMHTGSQGFGVQFASYVAAMAAAMAWPGGPVPLIFAGEAWNYGGANTTLVDVLAPGAACRPPASEAWLSAADHIAYHKVMLGRTNICQPGPAAGDPFCEPMSRESDGSRRRRGGSLIKSGGGDRVRGGAQWGLAFHSKILAAGAALEWFPGGAREWEALLTAALFCPGPRILARAAEAKAASGLPWDDKPVIGLHIRRGDRTDLHKHLVADYFDEVAALADELATDAVWVAADAAETLEAVEAVFGERYSLYSLWHWARDAPGADVAWGGACAHGQHAG